MDPVVKFVREFEPLARAIVDMAAVADRYEALETRFKELEVRFEQRKDEWDAAEAAAKKARASVDQANAEIIAAQARVDQLSKSASERAQKLLANAKAEALAEAGRVSNEFREEHDGLKSQSQDALVELVSLQERIAAKRKEHDAVMESMAALKSRLGAV